MSTSHADHSKPTSNATAPPARPGWPEVIVGTLAAFVALPVIRLFGLVGLDEDPVVHGLILTAWSGVAGLIGFTVAALIRIRSWGAFSVRRTSGRWVLVGVAAGVIALVVKGLLNTGIIAVTGFSSDPQGTYYDAAGGGVLPLILTFVFLSVLTPIGEEFFFRGVVTNALLRYGPVIGVLSSSLFFAVVHGINIALPSAFVVGIIAAEVMRRSGSIWPAVIVHAVNNAALPLLVLLTGTPGPAV
ncbi:CPBP family intramembrane glutamic endopeptidase [Myceligenerans salitolerans]|uniref:CPBP family intramembrane metalloprotease n=1 Tax=Myceligenerans salitolerans TaxID=1230528 RepID=A0ABS3I498_9MICO|nr:CPBP family intramembrane glutamic endopeptidase [Myceligenerans salitolerans]MBO0607830.1 CPBP family intramembrane metalloprotease [Myceligenerans salitolerans]